MRLVLTIVFTAFAGTAAAQAPKVSADILPVHSLVARVMDGAGTPDLILPPGADPHGYSMRPSEAAALERADVIFWIGDALTPWLEKPLDVLAGDARHVALLDSPGTHLREVSEAADDHDNHGHDDYDDHDHGPTDPHAWLDPVNAAQWLDTIADVLAGADPANEALYRKNASDAKAEIDVLTSDIEKTLAPVLDRHFAVYHDAYGYFQDRFGLQTPLALLSHEAERPSPSRIGELREFVNSHDVGTAFVEPQSSLGLVETVFEGVPVAICEIDPIGAGIEPGPKHYWLTLDQMAQAIAGCGAP